MMILIKYEKEKRVFCSIENDVFVPSLFDHTEKQVFRGSVNLFRSVEVQNMPAFNVRNHDQHKFFSSSKEFEKAQKSSNNLKKIRTFNQTISKPRIFCPYLLSGETALR